MVGQIIIKPGNKKARLEKGKTLLSYIQELGVTINASCGGNGVCQGCLVRVHAKENLSDLTDIEKKNIKKPGYRLACQAKILREDSDVLIHVPLYSKYKILSEGQSKKVPLHPFVEKKLSHRKEKVFWKNREISDYQGEMYGLALDVGTTTISMYWINLESGVRHFTTSMLNPQIRYGDNIIDRINYSRKYDQRHLETTVKNGINEMILKGPVDPLHIYEMVVVGNTVMRDIFVGHSVGSLGGSPFEPLSTYSTNKMANDLKIAINPKANVYALPLLGHFVGADALSVILATEMYKQSEIAIAVDIGTNTEIAIGNKDRIIVTSCASGPAFEGSGIKCGIGAVEGAIQKLEIRDDLEVNYETINNVPPTGICGSGLIDALAQMLDRNIIDWTGKFTSEKEELFISPRMRENGRPLFIDGEDIDNLKLAKSAIHVGIKTLLKHYGIGIQDIEKLYLAGAFGNYIDLQNALKIGLLPDMPLMKIVKIGNAAIEGARQALISQEKRQEVEKIPARVTHIRLEMEKDFHDRFVEGLCFEKYIKARA